METTLYDDASFRSAVNNLKPTKRPATLDLVSPGPTAKKQKFFSILTSPDLNMLKLASPELERIIIASNGAITTTPTPTQYLFPRNVTEEQEKYAKGFVDALALLHQSGDSSLLNHIMENVAASSGNSLSPLASTLTARNYTGLLPANLQSSSLSTSVVSSTIKPSTTSSILLSSARPPSVESSSSNSYPGALSISVPKNLIKEELQTVPSDTSSFGTPPLSPINLEDQERIKLERKRYRNRVAATKCRQRKIQRISNLEDKVNDLKTDNAKLETTVKDLRSVICNLKQEIMNHVKFGCQIMLPHVNI